ncbi:hypothetical protein AB0H34_28455 [Saccharopolyspora shandongensis]|uniref:hypothetical protein n=1 Tax=Saccharopolyspora shandongensis TaxID=418495 RepID=UPI0033D1599B
MPIAGSREASPERIERGHGRGTDRVRAALRRRAGLLITKGVYGWQHLFADVQLHADEYIHARKRLTTMLQVLPEIFPGHDYEPLRARLAQRLR